MVEIGVGKEPLFKYLDDFEQYYFFEPEVSFYKNATEIAKKSNIIGINNFFYADDKVKKAMPDFIICSSLLHEVENPGQILNDIVNISNEKTIIHINVPNAFSIHRILAKTSGLIKDVKSFSERNILLQQASVFDMNVLTDMVKSYDLKIIEQGSYFIKPFTHEQMQRMLDEKIIDVKILEGLYNLTNIFPDYGSEIYVNCVISC